MAEAVPVPTEAAPAATIVETRIVAPPDEAPVVEVPQASELVICLGQEPNSLYPLGGDASPAATAVQHAIFENDYTTLTYGYQPQGLEKLPSLADGDAQLQEVIVGAGDRIVDASGRVTHLVAGVSVVDAAGEVVEFAGEPLRMQQMVAEFRFKPRFWADGEPVKASDSVYAFALHGHPDTPAGKQKVLRTAAYGALDDHTTRWTGLPGYVDPAYFTNFWPPLPEHLWGDYSAAELPAIPQAARLPTGDGPFRIESWQPGDSIRLVRNEYYYRRDGGLPRVDRVTFRFFPTVSQWMTELLFGSCHIGLQLPIDQVPVLVEAESIGLLATHFQTGTVFEHIDFGINSYGDYGDHVGRPDWFEDRRVRRAMTLCTDRQRMVDELMYGRSIILHSYIPRDHPLYPGELIEWPYDPAAGRALLDEAGYADPDGDGIRNDPFTGRRFNVSLISTTGQELRQQLAELFRQDMRACGIEVALNFVSAEESYADGPEGPLFGRRFELAQFAWLTGLEPPCDLYLSENITGPLDEAIPGHYRPGTPFGGWDNNGNTGWISEAFDAACRQARRALPGSAAYTEGHQAAARIFAAELPVIPLLLRVKVAATRPEVINFAPDPTQDSSLYNIGEIDLRP